MCFSAYSLGWFDSGLVWRPVTSSTNQMLFIFLEPGEIISLVCIRAHTHAHILCILARVSACSTAVLTLVQLEALFVDVVKSTVCRWFSLLHKTDCSLLQHIYVCTVWKTSLSSLFTNWTYSKTPCLYLSFAEGIASISIKSKRPIPAIEIALIF